MNYSRLGILGIALALLYWLVSLGLRHFIFDRTLSPLASALELLLLLGGGLLFWWWIARRLSRIDSALRYQSARLEALHRAGLAITTERDLGVVLQTVVEQSRLLIGARYGALGVLNETGDEIESFIVSGLSSHTEALLRPHSPKGHGILGIPIRQRRSVRVDDIGAHPASAGFPPHHPPMTTFLGAPITSKGKVFGHLYLTDKYLTDTILPESKERSSNPDTPNDTGENESTIDAGRQVEPPLAFNAEDQQLLEMFATQAAIAIENASLYRQNREIAVLRERERFGMDLHDGIIQSIYAIGLQLDDGLHRMDGELPTAKERIQEAIQRLNTVIGDIRRYIHDLRTHGEHPDSEHRHSEQPYREYHSEFQSDDANPVGEFERLAHRLRVEANLNVRLTIDASVVRSLTPRQNAELMQIAREATANIRRHAQATRIQIELVRHDGDAVFSVADDGRGFEYAAAEFPAGHGLHNMRRRAGSLGGTFTLHSAPQEGCTVRVEIPISTGQ